MWYKIDIQKLGHQLLPPVLRSAVLLSLLKVLLSGIRSVYELFWSYRSSVKERLDTTAQTMSIEAALNGAFYLTDGQIRIEADTEEQCDYWHLLSEGVEGETLYMLGGTGKPLKQKGEKSTSYSFVVYVPSFLCTSMDADEDKYGGENLKKIKTILNTYKPAGRTYRIEIYDYE